MEDYMQKVSGLILNGSGELLLCRSKNKTVWISPGGKRKEGESDLECLKRELNEEALIDLIDAKFLLETPVEPAAGKPGEFVQMRFYIVNKYEGTIKLNPVDPIEEFMWISKDGFLKNIENKSNGKDFKEIGSGLEIYAIPKLIEMGMMVENDELNLR
jgi:8-oxo-dGTP diphosphatase